MLKPRPLESYLAPRTRLSRRYWIFPILLCAATAVATYFGVEEAARLERIKAETGAMKEARNAAPPLRPKPAELTLQKYWSDLRRERGFPWQRTFEAVESADQANIELLEFRPDKRTRQILLRGEARDQDSLTAYLQALDAVPTLTQVYLVNRRPQPHDKLTTISFEIKATLRP